MLKKCSKCKVEKSTSEFNVDQRSPTKRLMSICRECRTFSDQKIVKVINKAYRTEVYITFGHEMEMSFVRSSAEEGKEISREEFSEQLKEASRLIVLEP